MDGQLRRLKTLSLHDPEFKDAYIAALERCLGESEELVEIPQRVIDSLGPWKPHKGVDLPHERVSDWEHSVLGNLEADASFAQSFVRSGNRMLHGVWTRYETSSGIDGSITLTDYKAIRKRSTF
jgi:hypothetical protein